MRKGEIWLIDLTDGKGHEQQGMRPGLVVGKGGGLIITIPLTSNLDRSNMPFTEIIDCTPHNGLRENSVALIFQIISLDQERFKHKKGEITKEQYETIHSILMDMTRV